jgi:hypothetical protein
VNVEELQDLVEALRGLHAEMDQAATGANEQLPMMGQLIRERDAIGQSLAAAQEAPTTSAMLEALAGALSTIEMMQGGIRVLRHAPYWTRDAWAIVDRHRSFIRELIRQMLADLDAVKAETGTDLHQALTEVREELVREQSASRIAYALRALAAAQKVIEAAQQ